jgi:hypothetical protein
MSEDEQRWSEEQDQEFMLGNGKDEVALEASQHSHCGRSETAKMSASMAVGGDAFV